MDQPSGPVPSAYPLVKSPPALNKFYTYRDMHSQIEAQTTYSLRDSKYISQGWGKVSLSVGTPLYVRTASSLVPGA